MLDLFDNQKEAIHKLHRYKVGALFMEPGSGKTRAAYELVRSVPDCDYVLWLTPFQVKANLRSELEKWNASNIHIEGIESLSNSDNLMATLTNRLKQSKRSFVVVDESLKIKNFTSVRTKRIIELGRFAEYRLILNGTPVSRNLLDVWSQMHFLSPLILNMDLAEFKNTFCEYYRIVKRKGNRTSEIEFIKQYHNIEHLYSLIEHYVYEVDLKLMLKQQYIELKYTVDEAMRESYQAIKAKYLDNENLRFLRASIFLELTQKMQHIYCCASEKFDHLDQIIKAHGISNVIVFTKYVDSLKAIQDKFQGLTVLSYQKHSLGHNMQQYYVTVFFDKVWDYALRLQATRRTFRSGQTNDCIYYDLTGNLGLETMIDQNIARKCSMLEYLKQHSLKQITNQL